MTGKKPMADSFPTLTKNDLDRVIRVCGGAGSGNFGHKGRPGKVGGSQSTGGGGGKFTKALSKKFDQMDKLEPSITSTITKITISTGGAVHGLKNKRKSFDSALRKAKEYAKLTNANKPDEAVDQLMDLVRYTAVYEPDAFVDSVTEAQRQLKEEGWVQYDHKWKNYFKPGNPYNGYNTVFVNSDGFMFELQFHTPRSVQIKREVHSLYEEFRTLPEGSPKSKKLYNDMVSMWTSDCRPAGWEKLPGRKME